MRRLVASLAEAWIEIPDIDAEHLNKPVASLAEAWIEILSQRQTNEPAPSPPSRRRGLK